MGSLASPLATCGILSIGDMGVGIAKLLIAHDFKVITNASDRSKGTQDRAKKNNIDLVPNDDDLVNESDYIISIVPPRDAISTAERIITASSSPSSRHRSQPLYFLDLNAVSPKTARHISHLISTKSPSLKFIDGGIIGGPPTLGPDGTWTRPSIPISGPHALTSAQPHGDKLASILNTKYVNSTVGSATGLKMCFASLSKGFTALAIQSFTTAYNLGVLPELKEHMAEFNPAGLQNAERSLPSMCPKAYRWVHEMREIAETFEADGGFVEGESMFRSIAEVYALVADGTVLGEEKVGERVKGKTSEEVARFVSEGTKRREEKVD